MWRSKREISRECNDIIGSAKGSQISEQYWGEVGKGKRVDIYLEVRKRRGHIFFEWNKCLWWNTHYAKNVYGTQCHSKVLKDFIHLEDVTYNTLNIMLFLAVVIDVIIHILFYLWQDHLQVTTCMNCTYFRNLFSPLKPFYLLNDCLVL
jgi:hypothetical protein